MRQVMIFPATRLDGSVIVVEGVGRFYCWSEALAAKKAAGRRVLVDICGAVVRELDVVDSDDTRRR
jgi:hypothetical protein